MNMKEKLLKIGIEVFDWSVLLILTVIVIAGIGISLGIF